MGGFFDAFEVYNRKKHATGDVYGGGHSNVGSGNTTFMFAHEYYGPSGAQKKDAAAAALAADVKAGKVELVNGQNSADSSRKSSVVEESSAPQMVDISKLNREEFQALYNKMQPEVIRKGEPNNKVNF
ncbi:unnamed protein product [Kluyveromyces dobzhanskii CBS 2104]|uniref:Stationary phase protein 4 n=1 Tax=Kluyveromyces dobzhanskii CBS 2104 TaxID=1427455 RepID=A0A0A8LCS9_9SACH|nr:unnamed protein product [Kluyveromyces dobzhanskii CBS 2104]